MLNPQKRRERLHGHNYRVALTVSGSVGSDGYVVDFGEVKRVMRGICGELDEHFLLPDRSPFLGITEVGGQVDIVTNSGSRFSFPAADVLRLPVCNVSVEELAQHICRRFVERLTLDTLQAHAVVQITVGVAETANQEARFTVDVSRGGGSGTCTPTAAAGVPPLHSLSALASLVGSSSSGATHAQPPPLPVGAGPPSILPPFHGHGDSAVTRGSGLDSSGSSGRDSARSSYHGSEGGGTTRGRSSSSSSSFDPSKQHHQASPLPPPPPGPTVATAVAAGSGSGGGGGTPGAATSLLQAGAGPSPLSSGAPGTVPPTPTTVVAEYSATSPRRGDVLASLQTGGSSTAAGSVLAGLASPLTSGAASAPHSGTLEGLGGGFPVSADGSSDLLPSSGANMV